MDLTLIFCRLFHPPECAEAHKEAKRAQRQASNRAQSEFNTRTRQAKSSETLLRKQKATIDDKLRKLDEQRRYDPNGLLGIALKNGVRRDSFTAANPARYYKDHVQKAAAEEAAARQRSQEQQGYEVQRWENVAQYDLESRVYSDGMMEMRSMPGTRWDAFTLAQQRKPEARVEMGNANQKGGVQEAEYQEWREPRRASPIMSREVAAEGGGRRNRFARDWSAVVAEGSELQPEAQQVVQMGELSTTSKEDELLGEDWPLGQDPLRMHPVELSEVAEKVGEKRGRSVSRGSPVLRQEAGEDANAMKDGEEDLWHDARRTIKVYEGT